MNNSKTNIMKMNLKNKNHKQAICMLKIQEIQKHQDFNKEMTPPKMFGI